MGAPAVGSAESGAAALGPARRARFALAGYGHPARRRRPPHHVIAHGEPEQAKTLLAILIADLRINSRAEVLPTYRVGAPTVCAPTSSVEPTRLNANRLASLPGGRISLNDGN